MTPTIVDEPKQDASSVVAYALISNPGKPQPQIARMVTRSEMDRFQYSGSWMPLHCDAQLAHGSQAKLDDLQAKLEALKQDNNFLLQHRVKSDLLIARLQETIERQRIRREKLDVVPPKSTDTVNLQARLDLRHKAAMQICQAWQQEWSMGEFVRHLLPQEEHAFVMFRDAMGEQWIDAAMPVRAWVRYHMAKLSEALWSGRPNEKCEIEAQRAFGLKTSKIGRLIIDVRKRDKHTDWNTVK